MLVQNISRRNIVKSVFVAASLGITVTSIASAQTPESSPEPENTGEFTSGEGHIELTWGTEAWELWESDDDNVVIGSEGDGSAPYAYRFRSMLSERDWESGEAQLADIEEAGDVFGADGVTLIDSRAEENALGYIRKSQSPGGEAYSIFEFKRVSENENLWISSESWIHVDVFEVEAATEQYESLELNGQPVPTLWTIEEALELIAEDAG